jgi:hypothetical protein
MIVKDLKETIIGMQQNPYQVRCLGTKNTRRARQGLLWHPVPRRLHLFRRHRDITRLSHLFCHPRAQA